MGGTPDVTANRASDSAEPHAALTARSNTSAIRDGDPPDFTGRPPYPSYPAKSIAGTIAPIATSIPDDSGSEPDSSVEATTIQPRIGLRSGEHIEIWLGGYILDAEEKHSGTVDLDLGLLGGMLPVDGQDAQFAVDLSQEEDFNPSIGMHMMMTDAWEATIEVGWGDRRTALANFTYRF